MFANILKGDPAAHTWSQPPVASSARKRRDTLSELLQTGDQVLLLLAQVYVDIRLHSTCWIS